jgi:Gas vesicle synthesis protein GvpL/GvpF
MLYVYGIVRSDVHKSFDIEPLPGGDVVQTVPAAAGLAFVSSDIGDAKPRASRANLLAHTRVLETIMKEADVLPIRFGTMIESNVDGGKVLADNADEIARAFASIEGRDEISLKIHWLEGKVYEEIMARNGILRRERDALSGSNPSQSHYARIEFGKKVESAVAEVRARDRDMIVNNLREFADQMVEGPILDDSMVVNLSFLIRRDQMTAFDAAVERLDDVYDNRWSFRYVGPMPAFSFVDLKIDFAPEKESA